MEFPKDWPVETLKFSTPKWPGVLNEPLCLFFDLHSELEARFAALETELGVPLANPHDATTNGALAYSPTTYAFCFKHVPGFWPPGWGPKGPLRTRGRPGRKKQSPAQIAAMIETLRAEGYSKLESCFAKLAKEKKFEGMSESAIKAAYYRELKPVKQDLFEAMFRIFIAEDELMKNIPMVEEMHDKYRDMFSELNIDLMRGNWRKWKFLLIRSNPGQLEVLEKYEAFEHRPMMLSLLMLMLIPPPASKAA